MKAVKTQQTSPLLKNKLLLVILSIDFFNIKKIFGMLTKTKTAKAPNIISVVFSGMVWVMVECTLEEEVRVLI